MVDRPHPLDAVLGEVVVGRHEVRAAAGEGVEIQRQRGDERLTLAGAHLRDAAIVEDGAADELDVEVPHAQGAPACFPADREGFGYERVEDFPVGQPLSEDLRLVGQRLVGEGLQGRFERVDVLDDRTERLDFPVVFAAENDIEQSCEHQISWISRQYTRFKAPNPTTRRLLDRESTDL